MTKLLYVTTNKHKFIKAKNNLEPFGIELSQKAFETQEIQTTSGATIAKDKAQQAYQAFKQPLLVNDDSWSIPALHGFPGTNMKQCNHYLQAEDWLRLMNGIEDRTVYLISHYAYHDGQSIHLIQAKDERYFLHKAQGTNKKSPCLEVIARQGKKESIAQEIAQGEDIGDNQPQLWKKLAKIVSG